MKSIIWVVLFWIPSLVISQQSLKVNKYSIGIEIDVGHSFPDFDKEQDRWKGTFYPVGGLNVLSAIRMNQRWMLDLGVGITGYALTNRGIVDKYVLDFASPTLSSGISYHAQSTKSQENFIKMTGGLQVAYQGTLVDEFETYRVTVEGNSKMYPFIRPEIGIRRYFRQKMKGSRYKMAYEFGTYFRYNFNTLGKATIEESDFSVTLEPSGNVIGGYFRIRFPAGRKWVESRPEVAKVLPPVIYNPRYLR